MIDTRSPGFAFRRPAIRDADARPWTQWRLPVRFRRWLSRGPRFVVQSERQEQAARSYETVVLRALQEVEDSVTALA